MELGCLTWSKIIVKWNEQDTSWCWDWIRRAYPVSPFWIIVLSVIPSYLATTVKSSIAMLDETSSIILVDVWWAGRVFVQGGDEGHTSPCCSESVWDWEDWWFWLMSWIKQWRMLIWVLWIWIYCPIWIQLRIWIPMVEWWDRINTPPKEIIQQQRRIKIRSIQ